MFAKKQIITFFILITFITFGAHADNLTGSKAPTFELSDQSGKMHKLSDYAGKWVVLYFYPRNHTSGCTVEAGAFRDMQAKFADLNTTIMGVSVDDVESHKSFHSDLKLNFDLLSDNQQTVSKDYQVLNDLVVVKYSKRQTFIIDPMGMVAHHFEDVDPDTHAQETYDKLQEVQKIYSM